MLWGPLKKGQRPAAHGHHRAPQSTLKGKMLYCKLPAADVKSISTGNSQTVESGSTVPVGSNSHTRGLASVSHNGRGAATWKVYTTSGGHGTFPALGKWKQEDREFKASLGVQETHHHHQHHPHGHHSPPQQNNNVATRQPLLRKALQHATSCEDTHFRQGAQRQLLLCAGKLLA